MRPLTPDQPPPLRGRLRFVRTELLNGTRLDCGHEFPALCRKHIAPNRPDKGNMEFARQQSPTRIPSARHVMLGPSRATSTPRHSTAARENYRVFRERLHVPLIAIELAFDGRFGPGEGRCRDAVAQFNGVKGASWASHSADPHPASRTELPRRLDFTSRTRSAIASKVEGAFARRRGAFNSGSGGRSCPARDRHPANRARPGGPAAMPLVAVRSRLIVRRRRRITESHARSYVV
jgi:hypothetical protein